MADLATEMLDYRAEHNISQRTLAKMCNLTVQTICNVENGVASPTRLTKMKILKVIKRKEKAIK